MYKNTENMKQCDNLYQDADLIKKVLLGEASESEKTLLEEKMAGNDFLRKMYAELESGKELQAAFDSYQRYSASKAYNDLLQKASLNKHSRPTFLYRWAFAAVAACLAVAVVWSVYLTQTDKTEVLTMAEQPPIYPGSYQARLTLSGGKTIDMQSESVEVEVDGVKVNYNKGVISYYHPDTASLEEKKEIPASLSNQLVIPRGAENTVILSDGTTVHLNAGSKLTYPVRFGGGRRIVLLEGEAYFDVVKNEEHPFVVQTRFGDITVLGTSFNINAYPDASAAYTTLVSGKVRCNRHQEVGTLELIPGEQAVQSVKGISKRTVNVEEYVGWANGLYVFNHKSLGEIMETFERWYDVHVHYEYPELKQLTYSGNLKRYNKINTFLDALEITGDIYYRINGNNILIYKCN